jgi:Trk K+ transport system NAD-binding subunit
MSRSRIRRWRASWRDTLLLLRQFRVPLLIFLSAILGCGLAYAAIARRVGEPLDSLPEALYLVLTLSFLQPSGGFPHHPLLQVFYFIMPLLGIGTLALGLADFGILLFNRHARSKEWEMAVASTFSKHTILVGLGHLGFRVVERLHRIGASLVVVEINPSADLLSAVQKMSIPVIQEDATRQTALEAAGVRRARTLVLCSQNDAMNLKIAVKARSLNPRIKVVIRIFDDDFAESLQQQFGFNALSATAMAAPAFAAAAAGTDITDPITVEGQPLSLARLKVDPGSRLKGQTVGEAEQRYGVSVVLIKSDGEQDLHPASDRKLAAGDTLAVLGGPEPINQIVHDNR